MTTVRDFVTRWGFDVDFGPLEKMENKLETVRTGFLKIGAVATGALAGIVAPAAILEDALRRSASAANKTGADFDVTLTKLNGLAKDFSEELGFSATEVSKGFFDVISAGFDPLTKDFDDFSKTSLKLAKVAGGDVGATIEELNTALKAFGFSGQQAGLVADTFAKANFLGATSISQLSAGMRVAGPIMAQTMGAGLSTTTALLTAFADAGFKAENGGEALKQVALRLAAPTNEAAGIMKRLGISTTNADGSFRNVIDVIADFETATSKLTDSSKAQALSAIFGAETVGKMSALMGIGSAKLREYEKALDNANGSLDQTVGQMESGIMTLDKFWSAVKNLAATIGEPLLGPLEKIGKVVLNMVVQFRKFLTENPKLTTGLSYLGSALLGIIAIGSGLGILAATFKLVAIAASKMGTAGLLSMLKMAIGPILIVAAFAALFLMFEDLASALSGQDSMIGDLIKKYPRWSAEIKSLGLSAAAAAIALGLAFAPVTLLVALFAVLATVIAKNQDAYGQFWGYLKANDLGTIFGDLADWVAYLFDMSKAWQDIKKWIDEATTSISKFFSLSPETKKFLQDVKGFAKFVTGGGVTPEEGTATSSTGLSSFFPETAPVFSSPASASAAASIARDVPINAGQSSKRVEVNVGGITVQGATDPDETARIIERRLGLVMSEAGDTLLED